VSFSGVKKAKQYNYYINGITVYRLEEVNGYNLYYFISLNYQILIKYIKYYLASNVWGYKKQILKYLH